jgi:toxin HigB-1
MDIIFADKKLEKYANDYKLAQRKLGDKRARLYHQRLDDMSDSESFDVLIKLPGNYHQLRSDRSGEWGCDLDQPYRLVFSGVSDTSGIVSDLSDISIVKIIEITNYHKEH